MTGQLALALYSLLMRLVQPLLQRKLRRRGAAEPGYLEATGERLGYYSQPPARGALWIHAVSMGETRAAAALIARLRQALPGTPLLLTHGTATGRAEGAGLLQPGDTQVWQAWDSPAAVQRFLAHFSPRAGLLMETEVWPNLTHACAQRGIPLLLVNARMNASSAARATRLRWLSRPAYAALTAVYAQSPLDADRLQALGASVAGVFGNLKFDAQPDLAQRMQGRQAGTGSPRPVVLLASSRAGEESLFLESILALANIKSAGNAINSEVSGGFAWPVQWLVVPRHPQRFDEVAALIGARGLSVSRRSQWGADAPGVADVWLGDTMGEMSYYYGLAQVALLGGSFAPLGGQNLIEALACGCPVVMGPHTFNFAEAAQGAQAAGAAWQTENMASGLQKALQLAGNTAELAAASTQGERFIAAHAGAVDKTCAALLPWLQRRA
ncbi:MAG: 3-deoxy-D-manno-octulosonic acid transferase [Burkholderiaceae bacterium]